MSRTSGTEPLWISLLALLLCWACTDQTVDTPNPPSMMAVLQAFESPSAPLSQETISAVAEELAAIWDVFLESGALEPILGAAFATGGDEEERAALSAGPRCETRTRALSVGGETVQGEGFMDITRICTGWDGGPPDAKVNGKVTLTGVFSEAGLNPVIWGKAMDCLYEYGGQEIFLDGEVKIHTGDTFSGSDAAEIVVSFAGDIEIDGQAHGGGIEFLLGTDDGRFELNVETDQGNVVFVSGSASTGFRASNGTWECSFWDEGGFSCESGDQVIEYF